MQTHSIPLGCFLLSLFCWILLITPTSKHWKSPELKLGALLLTLTLPIILPSLMTLRIICMLTASTFVSPVPSCPLNSKLYSQVPIQHLHFRQVPLKMPHICLYCSLYSLGKDTSVYPRAQTKTLEVIMALLFL